MLSTIFESVTIHDGTGAPAYQTDVATYGPRIALIGDLSERDAARRIDGRSLALAPGFIDVHSHSDELWLADPRALSKIRQGVTTEIAGNCGTSIAPLRGEALERKRRQVRLYKMELEWESFAGFFELVERHGVALNVASLVGLGTTRTCISGPSSRRLEREEIAAQATLVREAVEQGALGASSGLIYEPSRYADIEELIAMAQAAAAGGAPLYASHLRNEGDQLAAAVDEALEIGRRAEVAVQCSHHKAAGKKNWGKVHATLQAMDRARARGQAVAADVYPYVAMWTDLATVLPDDVREGGEVATLERLTDPETATAIALALNLTNDGLWHDMLITDVLGERNAGLAGMRMDEIARHWRSSPAHATIRLLREERLQVQAAFFNMHEDDVATVIGAAFVCIGSDASAIADTGVTARGVPHPRAFGCFPRVFGRYVRQRKTLALEEAVRRMTSLPADIFGLRGRGRIEPGAYADLVLFDAQTIGDTATYERPYSYPVGIEYVFVNGEAVVARGEPTGALPGRVLRGGRA